MRTDQHAEFGHYGLVAAMAVIVILASLIGSSALAGRRLVAGLAVGGLSYIGVASISFVDQMSSLGTAWGVAAVVAGLTFGWGAMAQPSERMP